MCSPPTSVHAYIPTSLHPFERAEVVLEGERELNAHVEDEDDIHNTVEPEEAVCAAAVQKGHLTVQWCGLGGELEDKGVAGGGDGVWELGKGGGGGAGLV